MIISSLDRLHPTGTLQTQICIVGAGAAGITLACELDACGVAVLLLESGGWTQSAATVDDYAGNASAPHPKTTEFRRAAFGGTTAIWGGRCVPLDPIDFEKRAYIPDSGWPIDYDEVARHYPKALAYCDAGSFDFSIAGALAEPSATVPGLEQNAVLVDDRIERYSLPTHFGKRYRQRLAASANVQVLLHARCTGLVKKTGEDRIDHLYIVDQAGHRVTVHARHFVIAAGGIEVPRLLMHSEPDGAGLGNRRGNLGRYYACHFENTVARMVSHAGRVPFDFEKTRDGVYCRRKLQFTPAAQHRHGLLNTAFRFHFPDYSNAAHGSAVMSTIFLAKALLIAEYRTILQHGQQSATVSATGAHLRNISGGLPDVLRFGAEWLVKRQLAERKLPYTLVANADGSFPLEFNCEQTPLASNRITLTDDVDRHGMRRVAVSWKIGQDDVDAAFRGFQVMRDTLRERSACRLEFNEDELRQRIASSAPLGGHHIGTARMADSPATGVVDRQCAVFDLPNLFIASAAVFPTSGHANPTLTIVALAIRLAAHLKSLYR